MREKQENLCLREIQLEELKILEAVTSFISKNKLRYTLYGGTLLGAIRHKGFIPWDDDVDICMPRPDYNKFIELFTKYNEDNNLQILCSENNNSFRPFCKIVNKNIRFENNSFCDQEKRYLWIDVFPIDGLPQSDKQIVKDNKKISIYAKLLYIHYYKVNIFYGKKYLKNLMKLILKPISLLITPNTIIKIATKYDYNDSKYVGNIVWGAGIKEKNLKSLYDEYIDIEFEGKKFKSIKNYDLFLTRRYGDYMTPIPDDKRKGHIYKAWRE